MDKSTLIDIENQALKLVDEMKRAIRSDQFRKPQASLTDEDLSKTVRHFGELVDAFLKGLSSAQEAQDSEKVFDALLAFNTVPPKHVLEDHGFDFSVFLDLSDTHANLQNLVSTEISKVMPPGDDDEI